MNPLLHSMGIRGHLGLALVALLFACGPAAETAPPAPTIESQQADLRDALLKQDKVAAETAARALGSRVNPVLSELQTNEDAAIRRSVLDIAGTAPTVDNCRLMIAMLDDTVAEVRER